MTDPVDEWRLLLGHRDDLAAIPDSELDRIREKLRMDHSSSIRRAQDEIGRLPDADRPDQDARRRAEISWLSAILEALQDGLE